MLKKCFIFSLVFTLTYVIRTTSGTEFFDDHGVHNLTTHTTDNFQINNGTTVNIPAGVIYTATSGSSMVGGVEGPLGGLNVLNVEGTLNMNSNGNLWLADWFNAPAALHLSGNAVVNVGGALLSARDDATLTVTDNAVLNITGSDYILGYHDFGTGPASLDAIFQMSGGSLTVARNFGFGPTANVTAGMSDGIIKAGSFIWNTSAAGSFEFSGGIIILDGDQRGFNDNHPWFNVTGSGYREIYNIGENVTQLTLSLVIITQTDGSTIVAENGPTSDSFTVELARPPNAPVTVILEPNVNGEDIKLNNEPAGTAINLVFTTGNWNSPQTVTVTAVDDTEVDPGEVARIKVNVSSNDPNFNGKAVPAVNVAVIDNEYNWPCLRAVGWYWWNMRDYMPPGLVRYGDLTHIVYNPEWELIVTDAGDLLETGAIDNNLSELVTLAHAHETKVLIMFVEGEEPNDFSVMMEQPSTRATFIFDVLNYLLTHDLDGVEYDWEGRPGQTWEEWTGPEGEQDRQNYTDLIIETKTALAPHNLIVSICGAAWEPCFVTSAAYDYLEFINIMSYHDIYHAIEGLNVWTNCGADRKLLNMGIGLFGRDYSTGGILLYKDIVQLCPDLEPQDDWCNNYKFNGPVSCQNHAEYVINNGYGGLFYFQINYDALDDKSLVKAVGETARTYDGFCPSYLYADFDGDGDVDLADLAVFVSWWMECTQPGEAGCQDRN